MMAAGGVEEQQDKQPPPGTPRGGVLQRRVGTPSVYAALAGGSGSVGGWAGAVADELAKSMIGDVRLLGDRRNDGGLETRDVGASVSENTTNRTTTFVDVLIEQNTTTYQNNVSGLGALENKTESSFLAGSMSIPWRLWDPSLLWLCCAVILLCTAFALGVLALRRDDRAFSSYMLRALSLQHALASAGYWLMSLGMGHLQEVYGVQVYEGITDSPGRLLWKATIPPVVWLRHLSWAITSSIQLHLLISVASTPPPSPLRKIGGSKLPLSQLPLSEAGGADDEAASGGGPAVAEGRSVEGDASGGERARAVPSEMRFYVLSVNSLLHVAGLIGTVVSTNDISKWLYWIFGLAMFAMMINQLTDVQGQISRAAHLNHSIKDFRALVRVTLAVWCLYPLVWAVGDGSRTLYWEIKEVVYSLLDLLAKYSFAAVLLWARARDVVPRTCQVLIERMLGVLGGAEREVETRTLLSHPLPRLLR